MKTLTAVSMGLIVAATGVALAGEPRNNQNTRSKPIARQAEQKPLNIFETAQQSGNFRVFSKLVEAAGMSEVLKKQGPFTVLAPNDEAFAKLPAGFVDELLKPANKTTLTGIVQFHIMPGDVAYRDLMRMKESSATLQGKTFAIQNRERQTFVGTDANMMAQIIAWDTACTNGVIHTIDTVIFPGN
jgi:uncharacterized surface protein with fasciclin (FAS1) repeats